MHAPVVVLGGGPGGYAAAFMAADQGLDVTLVEMESRLGGTCLLRGCIPSKALLHVANVMSEVEELTSDWGVSYSDPAIDIDKVRARKDKVISTLSGGLGQLAKRRKVKVITARGTFENSTTLLLEGEHDSIPEGGKLTFDKCILATGSSPAMPGPWRLDSDRVMDSTGALALTDIPETMLVIGGGYIGLEMGTVYANLGTEVSVVEFADGLVPMADRDIIKPLRKKLDELFGERIYTNTKVGSLTLADDQVEVTFEGPALFDTRRYDRVLVSVGRRPNSQNLGLENTQVKVTDRGFVECDARQQTADAHIYAIGDIAGDPMLAHKATHEAKVAVANIAGHDEVWDHKCIPAVMFTDPEIAWAGLTENEAEDKNIAHEVATYPWAASGRAQALGRTEGLTKLLVDPETNRVLGCGMVGPGAGELIAEAVLAIEMGCEVEDITESIHPHPTLSGTVMNAGEIYYGTAVEMYKPKKR